MVGEIIAGVEHVYADSANRVIPIVGAIQIVAVKEKLGQWDAPGVKACIEYARKQAEAARKLSAVQSSLQSVGH